VKPGTPLSSRQEFQQEALAAIAKNTAPLVIVASSGEGKSAFMAELCGGGGGDFFNFF
jgi:hypothetical protein